MALTRDAQKPDTIYLEQGSRRAFYTPDGKGRIWYGDEWEALEEHDAPVVHVAEIDDF